MGFIWVVQYVNGHGCAHSWNIWNTPGEFLCTTNLYRITDRSTKSQGQGPLQTHIWQRAKEITGRPRNGEENLFRLTPVGSGRTQKGN